MWRMEEDVKKVPGDQKDNKNLIKHHWQVEVVARIQEGEFAAFPGLVHIAGLLAGQEDEDEENRRVTRVQMSPRGGVSLQSFQNNAKGL